MRMKMVALMVMLGICGTVWGDRCTNPPGRFGLTDGGGIMVVVSRDPKDPFPGGFHDRTEWLVLTANEEKCWGDSVSD